MTLIIEAIGDLAPSEIVVRLDKRMYRSGELAAETRRRMDRAGLPGEARAVAVQEKELVYLDGPVATSDSALMDRVQAVFDLAGYMAVKSIHCHLLTPCSR